MDAFASACRVEQEASDRVCVVGDSGAVVKGEGRGCWRGLGRVVGVAGHGDGEAAGGEQGAELEGEAERDVLLEGGVADAGAAVDASVRWVEDDGGAVECGLRGDLYSRRLWCGKLRGCGWRGCLARCGNRSEGEDGCGREMVSDRQGGG